eukprot:s3115_g14.t2
MAGFPEPHVCLQPIDVETWRFPGALSLEAAVRTMLTSIRDHGKVSGPAFGFGGSSLKACSNSPTQLMLISIEMLAAYGQQFRNADTLIERVGHLRLFLRILHREPCIASSTWQQLLRGARKHKRRSNLPRLRHKRVVALVQVALEKGWDDLARLVVVARGLLFKELVPSQASHLEGRGNTSWHSFVKIKGRDVSVTMRIRKNAPEADLIKSSFVLSSQYPPTPWSSLSEGCKGWFLRFLRYPFLFAFKDPLYGAGRFGMCLLDIRQPVEWFHLRLFLIEALLDQNVRSRTTGADRFYVAVELRCGSAVVAFAELAQKLADPRTEVLAGSVVYEDLNTEKVGELAEDLASKMTEKLQEPAESPKVLQTQLKKQFAEALGILFQQGQENSEDRLSGFGA